MKHRFTLLTMVLFTLSFNPHIEAHDSRSQNYFDLGFNHLRQQRYEDGARMFRAAISHERRGDAYYYLAICEMKQNQFEKALSSLGKGLNLSDRPHAAEEYLIYLRMGDCHLQLRNVKEAVRCYQEAARLEPDNPVCLTSLAHALEEKGEKEQAKLVRAKLESLQSALSREKK